MSYLELAPHLAERVQAAEVEIAQGFYAGDPLDERLVLTLHRRICGDLVPAWAGCWRATEVQVGSHRPPQPWQVPLLMREYALDLECRMEGLGETPTDLWLEFLAFAEGRLLSVHPFADFNGRVTRLFMAEILRRINAPDVDLTPDTGEPTRRYLDALRAGDAGDWQPLARMWRERLENAFGLTPEA